MLTSAGSGRDTLPDPVITLAQARHDVLYAGIVLEAVHGEVLAVAGVLEAAVGHLAHNGDVRVDPHATIVQPPADPHRPAVVAGEDARGEAVPHAVGPAHRLVLVGERLNGDDGTEDLGLRHLVVLSQAGDDGRGVEVSRPVDLLASGDDLSVVREPLYHAGDVPELVLVVQGTVEDILVLRGSGLRV